MNCLAIRCINVKYRAMIKESYEIKIVLEQLDNSDDFEPEVLINGLSIQPSVKQKRANTLYFFSFWVNYSDFYIVQANQNTKLLSWEEHRNFDMYKEPERIEEHENIYYCSSTEENYKALTDKNFKDINECFKRLTNKHHIRFDLEQKILFWEAVGNFVLCTKVKRALFQHVSTNELKELLKEKT